DKEIVAGIEAEHVCLIGEGGAAAALLPAMTGEVRTFSRTSDWPPDASDADVIVNATPVRDELLVGPRPGQTVVDLAYRADGGATALVEAARAAGCEVVAGLRPGRTLGTPLALVVRNRDHKNWAWGMSPWPPEGEPEGKGTKPVTLPRPGHADLAGAQKFGLDDVRDALERASARQTAVAVAAGAVAKALLRELGIEVHGQASAEAGAEAAAVDAARKERDTLGGVVEVRA